MKMKDRILTWLKDYGSITTWEAIQELGCTRLSEYIRQLRLEYEIGERWTTTRNRYGEEVRFKTYLFNADVSTVKTSV